MPEKRPSDDQPPAPLEHADAERVPDAEREDDTATADEQAKEIEEEPGTSAR